VYGYLAIPLQHVDCIEERNLSEIDDVLEIPAHNDVAFGSKAGARSGKSAFSAVMICPHTIKSTTIK